MKMYRTYSSEETKKVGAEIAQLVLSGKSSRVIALRGDLGAGKTTFTQGFLRALGVRGRVSSPTFVLMKKFKVSSPRFSCAYHIDAYRLHSAGEAGPLGLKEILKDPTTIVVVEWPERLRGLIPRSAHSIRFKHGKQEKERIIIWS